MIGPNRKQNEENQNHENTRPTGRGPVDGHGWNCWFGCRGGVAEDKAWIVGARFWRPLKAYAVNMEFLNIFKSQSERQDETIMWC